MPLFLQIALAAALVAAIAFPFVGMIEKWKKEMDEDEGE